jgi:zinc D-Ala-D-Ala dipeptidase
MKLNSIASGKILTLLITCCLVLAACSNNGSRCGEHDNPYGLNIIHCSDDYRAAIAANPDMELIDLEAIIPGVVTDIKYATPDNFTGEVIYTEPKAWLRRPAALALQRLQDSLAHHNLGLKIWDAYRPYSASVKFFEVYPDTNFVANPRYGSRHNRGCAVDVTLVDLTNREEVLMPTAFDEFTERAHPEYLQLPQLAIENRTFLFGIMKHYGFTHYPTEWWHFDFNGWKNFPLMDLGFELLTDEQNRSKN